MSRSAGLARPELSICWSVEVGIGAIWATDCPRTVMVTVATDAFCSRGRCPLSTFASLWHPNDWVCQSLNVSGATAAIEPSSARNMSTHFAGALAQSVAESGGSPAEVRVSVREVSDEAGEILWLTSTVCDHSEDGWEPVVVSSSAAGAFTQRVVSGTVDGPLAMHCQAVTEESPSPAASTSDSSAEMRTV